jgi:hypothetical protein
VQFANEVEHVAAAAAGPAFPTLRSGINRETFSRLGDVPQTATGQGSANATKFDMLADDLLDRRGSADVLDHLGRDSLLLEGVRVAYTVRRDVHGATFLGRWRAALLLQLIIRANECLQRIPADQRLAVDCSWGQKPKLDQVINFLDIDIEQTRSGRLLN